MLITKTIDFLFYGGVFVIPFGVDFKIYKLTLLFN